MTNTKLILGDILLEDGSSGISALFNDIINNNAYTGDDLFFDDYYINDDLSSNVKNLNSMDYNV